MLDIRVDLSRPVLKDIAHRAFSPENWLKVGTYMAGRIDYEHSHALGQYYIRSK